MEAFMPLGENWVSPRAVVVRKTAAAVVAIAMMAWFFGGIIMFPDAPIHLCHPGSEYSYPDHSHDYCGKQGQSHTQADFRLFQQWNESLSSVWLPGMMVLVVLGWGLPGRKSPPPT